MSAPGECCIAGAYGQSWPCRSAWLVAFGSGSLVELEWLDEVVACKPEAAERVLLVARSAAGPAESSIVGAETLVRLVDGGMARSGRRLGT
jgi:hypothetical protein